MSQQVSARHVVAVSAGVSQPSSTRLLVDRVVASLRRIAADGRPDAGGSAATDPALEVEIVELRDLATDVAQATVAGLVSERLAAAVRAVTRADAVVLATPVYKASYSGLFKSFADLLDNDALVGTPVMLLATGGSPRHALAVDTALRPLVAYMRALATPTALYASPDDWAASGEGALAARVDRAAGELLTLMSSGAGRSMVGADWGTYQRTVSLDPDDHDEIRLDPELLRAATGGSLL